MGWGRMFLLGNIGQQMDLSEHRDDLDDLRSGLAIERAMREGADEMIGRLKREHSETKMYLAAVVRLLISRKLVTVEEIRHIVDTLDGVDGTRDGSYAGPVLPES